MKTKFHKTEHFLFRQWDRGIDDAVVEKITCNLKKITKTKSMIIAGTSFLKKLGIEISKNRTL